MDDDLSDDYIKKLATQLYGDSEDLSDDDLEAKLEELLAKEDEEPTKETKDNSSEEADEPAEADVSEDGSIEADADVDDEIINGAISRITGQKPSASVVNAVSEHRFE